MDEKKYHIDGQPASAIDIIRMARDLDDAFGKDGLLQASVAAGVLRRLGHSVGDLPPSLNSPAAGREGR